LSEAIIVLGDKTSHKGTVISASPFSDTNGKSWARIGDKVSCPLCGGIFPISEGNAGHIDDGKPVAYHGCKTACGATLIASSQLFTTTEPSAGAGGAVAGPLNATVQGAGSAAAAALLTQGFGSIGSGLLASYEEEPLDDERQRFRGRFQVVDGSTAEPVAGQAGRVRSTAGQYLGASTDAEGYTAWVERDAAEALAFDLTPPQEQA
jgi:uncharacterized Zn-binding protein involved in type VI secretion